MTPGAPFRAMYESKAPCPAGCGYRIRPGELVRYDDDDQLIHDACSPRPSKFDLGPREVVCGSCWLVKPCRCDDD